MKWLGWPESSTRGSERATRTMSLLANNSEFQVTLASNVRRPAAARNCPPISKLSSRSALSSPATERWPSLTFYIPTTGATCTPISRSNWSGPPPQSTSIHIFRHQRVKRKTHILRHQ